MPKPVGVSHTNGTIVVVMDDGSVFQRPFFSDVWTEKTPLPRTEAEGRAKDLGRFAYG